MSSDVNDGDMDPRNTPYRGFLERLDDGTLELTMLCLAAPISLYIFYSSYTKWRALPAPPRGPSSSSHASILLIAMVLSVICVSNAILAVADRSEPFVTIIFDVREPSSRSAPFLATHISTLPSAVVFVVLVALSLALDAYVTWMCYVLGQWIMEKPLPRWKTVVAHGECLCVCMCVGMCVCVYVQAWGKGRGEDGGRSE